MDRATDGVVARNRREHLQMSVLEDRSLRHLCEHEGVIDPYEPAMVRPASIDLRLGHMFRVPRRHRHKYIDLDDVPQDLMEPVQVDALPSGSHQGFVLHPGEFALGETFEWIRVPTHLVGRMEGKSSLGRIGLIVHVTAGFFDPGFEGRGTLEFVNLLSIPIVLRPGKPICQFSFQYLTRTVETPYQGRYQGDQNVEGSRYGRPPIEWCAECKNLQTATNRERLNGAGYGRHEAALITHRQRVHGPDTLVP